MEKERPSCFVIADTAGKLSCPEHVTARFVYVRLHGSRRLYASRYGEEGLERWAGKAEAWSREAAL
jgi:uncharacterized protein YecE (DUF72 family)